MRKSIVNVVLTFTAVMILVATPIIITSPNEGIVVKTQGHGMGS